MDDRKKIKDFIESELATGSVDSLEREGSSLIEAGVIDSLGIQKLIAFVEREFSIKIKDEDIVPENFDSVATIYELVRSKAS